MISTVSANVIADARLIEDNVNWILRFLLRQSPAERQFETIIDAGRFALGALPSRTMKLATRFLVAQRRRLWVGLGWASGFDAETCRTT
jgi:hypothetical protein